MKCKPLVSVLATELGKRILGGYSVRYDGRGRIGARSLTGEFPTSTVSVCAAGR
jgi:hypothetical protein